MSTDRDLDVAVVGAGVAGLTAAHELRRAGLQVRVFEAQDHVGGRMSSFRHGGFTVDRGAEQLPEQGYRATWQLLDRLGVTPEEVPRIGKALAVWRDGRAHPGLAGRFAPLTGPGLSPRALPSMARMTAWTAWHRRSFDGDHPERTAAKAATVRDFARRYHPDLHDYLLQPVAGSFFGWDTARSTVAPLLSLLLSVGPVSGWRTYHDGMDLLARRLAAGVDVDLCSEVREVVADSGGGVRVRLAGREVTARSAVLCAPAPVAARLHPGAPADESPFLSACTFTPVLKVSCLLDRPLAPPSAKPLYVLLTPRTEDDTLSAIIVDHAKHPGRAPVGKGLLTLVASPERIGAFLQAPDGEVRDRLVAAASRYVPGLRQACTAAFVHSFTHGLPEATPQALLHRRQFMDRPLRPVEYAGDWLTLRPASEAAVRAGALAASRVLARLRPRPLPRAPLSGRGAPARQDMATTPHRAVEAR
ncbi:NAD(P)/FAD-dependent oxidoreductase [Streptomyces sp. V3I7]|uniref:NAD(P)/FAD-dependent oxidoreductase n=1 Tax=Streptomyces sp. V3I7 TaxID=3042278 RepID=UPI002782E20B|nr:NAD(P)/FAD-dependent oxidoreductase [Streptomyces sp. V3I7]MDQ0994382.1 oxygen-dependent protoporphyrinogen oxidase [Streptomyces sp. V3I7]